MALTNLTASIPHIYGIIVGGINPFTRWIYSAQLTFVVLWFFNLKAFVSLNDDMWKHFPVEYRTLFSISLDNYK